MKACRVHQLGPPSNIVYEEIARPLAGDGEVLVRVAAAGVGYWDALIRTGKSGLPQPLPLTLGSDLAGVVEAVGAGVSGLAAGDEVFGVTNPRFIGAYAEYAVAAAGLIARKPRRLGFVEAAAAPVVAVTAWQMLFDHARLVAGQTVLVHGAGGSVGAYAVQLARLEGIHVIATASADDRDYVRELGAETIIDYRAARFEDGAHDVDAVLDTIGGEVQRRSFAVLKPGGVLISAVSEPDARAAGRPDVRAAFMLVDTKTAYLTRIAELIDGGKLRARVGTVLPLADAVQAHEMLDGVRPHAHGKIVLRVGG